MQTKLFWGVPVSGRSLGWWRWVSDSFLIVYEYSGLQMVVDRFIVPLFVKKKDPEEEEEENRRKQKSVEADMRSMDAGLEQQRVQEVERLHEEETEDSADTSTDMTHFRNSRDDILAAADHHEEHLLSSSSGKGNNVQHLPSPTSGAAPGPASAGLYNGESGDWGKESGVGEDTHLLVEAAQETTYKNDKKMNQHEDHIIIRGPPPDRPSVSSTSTFGQSPPGICAVFDIEADSSSSDPSPTGEKGRRKQEQEKVADEDGQGLLSTTAPEGGHDLGGGGDQQTVSSSSSASSAAVHDHFGTHGGDRMGKHQSTRPFGLHPVSSSSSLSSTSSASEQPVRGDPTDANEGDPDRSHHHGLSHTSSLSSNYSGRGVGAGVSLTSSNGGSMTMNGNCGTTSRGSDAARAMRSSRCVMSTVIGSIHIAPSSTLTISTSTPPQPQAPSQAHPPVVSTSTPPQPQAPSQAHPPVVVPPLKLDTLNQKKNIPLLSKEEESLNADLVHDDNQGGGEAEEEDLNHGMRLGGGFVPTPLSTPGENTAAVGDVGSSSSSSNHGNPVTSITVDQSTTSTPTRGGPLVGSAPASTNEDDIGSSAAANNVELQPESIIPEEEIEVAAVAAGAADPTSDTGQQGTRHRPSPQKNKNKRKKK
ncbi:unnamed protein product [Amoebophrya sp. A25]|nr:unnamed protein product [Amoebophrya sp. A25]|eukprot:GSA25T00017166001.1